MKKINEGYMGRLERRKRKRGGEERREEKKRKRVLLERWAAAKSTALPEDLGSDPGTTRQLTAV